MPKAFEAEGFAGAGLLAFVNAGLAEAFCAEAFANAGFADGLDFAGPEAAALNAGFAEAGFAAAVLNAAVGVAFATDLAAGLPLDDALYWAAACWYAAFWAGNATPGGGLGPFIPGVRFIDCGVFVRVGVLLPEEALFVGVEGEAAFLKAGVIGLGGIFATKRPPTMSCTPAELIRYGTHATLKIPKNRVRGMHPPSIGPA